MSLTIEIASLDDGKFFVHVASYQEITRPHSCTFFLAKLIISPATVWVPHGLRRSAILEWLGKLVKSCECLGL